MAYTPHMPATAVKHMTVDTVWTTDTLKATIHDSAAVMGGEFFNTYTHELGTGNGYTAGGVTLGTKAVTVSTPNVAYTAAASVWTLTGSLTARFIVVRKDTGTGSTSPVLAWIDLLVSTTWTAGALTFTWDTLGLISATATV